MNTVQTILHPAHSGAREQGEAEALYRLMEEQIVPAFCERDDKGGPGRWMGVGKRSIRTVAPRFCARRMVRQYAGLMYAPLARGEAGGISAEERE